MTAQTVTLNPGSGGAATLFDSLATVDGVAAPSSAVAQLVKVGHGEASEFKTASAKSPLPVEASGPEMRQQILLLAEMRLHNLLFALAFNLQEDVETLRNDILSTLT